MLVGVCRYTYWSNTQGNHVKEKGNQKFGISSFSTTHVYLSTNPSSDKIHTLFSLHFSQVALLFQHQTNIAQIITQVGWNKGEQSYMFQNASFVVLLNNNVLTTNDVFSAQARGKEPSDYQQLRRDEDTRGQFSSRFFLGFSLKWCFALVVS